MKTLLRRWAGHIPLGLFTISTALVWARFLSWWGPGGLSSISAWFVLISLVPLGASVLLLGTLVRTIWKRKKIGRLLMTVAIAAWGFWPASWMIGLSPMRYPWKLETSAPSSTVRLPTNSTMRVG